MNKLNTLNTLIEELCEDTTDYMVSINHERANLAMDAAINQQIDRSHLDIPIKISIKKEVKKLLRDKEKVEYVKDKKYKNIQELYNDLLTL